MFDCLPSVGHKWRNFKEFLMMLLKCTELKNILYTSYKYNNLIVKEGTVSALFGLRIPTTEDGNIDSK